ncbi:Electron transport complex protein RnfC [hydrothermal vent metagenome]|uniref:Electron transport complex protein RnfC n=1 Tax=hydrothermal vent metagenome TaxID=652676 RepID=A0A3B0YC02_9ZZZZ
MLQHMVTLLEKPATFPGGLQLASEKSQSLTQALTPAAIPARLYVPLSQNIGDAAEAVVKVGDKVLRGQLIARSLGYISAPVHAPTSGVVSEIKDYPVPHPSGLSAACIVIDSDGEDRPADTGLKMDKVYSAEPADIRQRVRDAGIVGLGGAGFPTAVKLNPGPDRKVELLIINGAECEPYISCDEALMCARPGDIVEGVRIMRHALKAQQVVIGIEDNMPNAIDSIQNELTRIGETDIRIVGVPALYPAGGEKQLIYALTGLEVPSQGLPVELGIICHNVATAAAIARAIHHGEPLISRVVTVTGAGVREPRNLDVRVGTPISALIEQCGGYTDEVSRLLIGGPMMGFALHSDQLPVIKTSNCVLAASAQQAPEPLQPSPCIRCAQCADVCPANLLPQQLYWYAFSRDMEKIQDYNLFDCIECGCCAQVCPSHLPLVQYYRFAKTEIWDMERERERSDLARQRHEARIERLERDKLALEQRRARARKSLHKKPKAGNAEAKKSEIEAALARVKAKKAEAVTESPRNTRDLTAEQQAKIEEVEQRRAGKARGA